MAGRPKKKRGVKPGTKRGPYKKSTIDINSENINDILEARLALRATIKARIKHLNRLLKRI